MMPRAAASVLFLRSLGRFTLALIVLLTCVSSTTAEVGENQPTGPLFAILSISDQHISVYNARGLVARSKVSTGMPGHPTPRGIFTIIGRKPYHRSNIYGGAPMPFMQRITWSGIAMHMGVVPGYPASHGCIRLPPGSAERLWRLTKVGERVIISPHEITPSHLTHPLLPTPKMHPAPAALVAAAPLPDVPVLAAAAGLPPKLLNPFEYAQALKRRAVSDIALVTKALTEQNRRNGPNSEVIRRALAELRAAAAAGAQAEARLVARTGALAAKRDMREIQRAEAAKAAAEAQLAEVNKRVKAALDSSAFTSPEGREALAAERALIEMRAALTEAQNAAREAERRLLPVSIFVSKRENKVYIRQAFVPVLEAPVTIRDAEIPLGTHVYIATTVDGAALGWSVVSYPTGSKGAAQASDQRQRGSRQEVGGRASAPSNAIQALERVELPPQVSTLISERLWTGGSLIISDQALSDETSDEGTDLVVSIR